jgi:hypothetical protein
MSKYLIEYDYTTGDSFKTRDICDTLPVEYTTLEKAEECVKRIEEHYLWYCNKEDYCPRLACPSKIEIEKPSWWNCNIKKDMEHLYINLPTENGEDFQMMPPWIGYFEFLNSVKIVIKLTERVMR